MLCQFATLLLWCTATAQWTYNQTFFDPNGAQNADSFGGALALSRDGQFLGVGATRRGPRGSAYLYRRLPEGNGTAWVYDRPLSTTAPETNYGVQIVIVNNGKAVFASAIGTSSSSSSITYMARNDVTLGWSVIGATSPPGTTTADYCGSGLDSTEDGLVVAVSCARGVFIVTPSTGSWTPSASLRYAGPLFNSVLAPPSGGATTAHTTAISADGLTVAFGSSNYDNSNGLVLVFRRDSRISAWDAGTRLYSSCVTLKGSLYRFGYELAMDPTGLTLVATIPVVSSGPGQAVVFRRSNTTASDWKCIQALNSTEQKNADQFGTGLTMDVTGNRVVVTAPGRQAAYVFTRADISQLYSLSQIIRGPDNSTNQQFPFCAAWLPEANNITRTTSVLVLGAPGPASGVPGRVHTYTGPDTGNAVPLPASSASPTPTTGASSPSASASATAVASEPVAGSTSPTSSASASATASSSASASATASIAAVAPEATVTATSSATISATSSSTAVSTATATSKTVICSPSCAASASASTTATPSGTSSSSSVPGNETNIPTGPTVDSNAGGVTAAWTIGIALVVAVYCVRTNARVRNSLLRLTRSGGSSKVGRWLSGQLSRPTRGKSSGHGSASPLSTATQRPAALQVAPSSSAAGFRVPATLHTNRVRALVSSTSSRTITTNNSGHSAGHSGHSSSHSRLLSSSQRPIIQSSKVQFDAIPVG